MNRLPYAQRDRRGVKTDATSGPKPAPHSRLKLWLADAVRACLLVKQIDGVEATRGHARLSTLNRAAVRRVQNFGRRRNWVTAQLVAELCAAKTRCVHA